MHSCLYHKSNHYQVALEIAPINKKCTNGACGNIALMHNLQK